MRCHEIISTRALTVSQYYFMLLTNLNIKIIETVHL